MQQVNTISFRSRMSPITFTDEDFKGVDPSQDDPMVISIDIDKFTIMKMLGRSGEFSEHPLLEHVQTDEDSQGGDEVVWWSCDRLLGWESRHQGYIELYTTFGKGKASKTIKIRYLMIDVNTFYNILLGWLSINKLREIVSILHLAMKFPLASGDILTVHVDHKIARECYATSLNVECTREDKYCDQSPRRKSSEGGSSL